MTRFVLSPVEGDALNKRTVVAVAALATVALPTPVHAQPVHDTLVDAAAHELRRQLRHPRVQPVSYWEKVAVCESSLDGTTARWDDGGQFAGGLGIFVGTWRNYGGRQFAPTPAEATKTEQIVIANRISVLGWQTRNEYLTLDDRLNGRPFFRPAAGFNGWGCVRNRKSLRPKKRTNNNTYTSEGTP